MRKKIKSGLVIATILLIFAGMQESKAIEKFDSDVLYEMECTAYCIDGITASGTHTREGICAGAPEMMGLTAGIYSEDMKDFYGWYEILDTGSGKIKDGKQLDIWLPTEEECRTFGRKKVKVQILDAKG